MKKFWQVMRAGASISRESTKKPSASSRSACCPHSKMNCRHQPHPLLPILWGSENHSKVSCYVQLSEQLIADGHLIELEDGMMCLTCGASKKGGLRNFIKHLETIHHFGKGYNCPFCEKMFWSDDHRQRHIYRVHKKRMSFRQIRELPPFNG